MKLLRISISIVILAVLATATFGVFAQNTDSYSLSVDVEGTPLPNKIKMEGFALDNGVNGNTNMPSGVGVVATQPSFFSSIFDGSSLWLCAASSDKLVKVSVDTGSMQGFSFAEGVNGNTNMGDAATKSGRFAGGILVDNEIWFVPYSINRLIKVNILSGTMKGFDITDGINGNTNLGLIAATAGKFNGAAYDGTNIWLIPSASTKLVKVNPQTGTMTGYDLTDGVNGNTNMPTGSYLFNGAVFDGTYIWMVPFNATKVVRLDPATGTMIGYDMTVGVNGNTNMGNLGTVSYKFYGAAFDGTNIWMIPGNADRVVKLNPSTGTMTGFEMTDGVNGNTNMGTAGGTMSNRFALGTFDGENIWMIPSYANRLVRLNPQTGAMTGYNLDEGEIGSTVNTGMGDIPTSTLSKFYGGSFDGENIWLVPWRTNRLIKVSPNEFCFTVEYYLDSYSNTPIAKQKGTSYMSLSHQLTQGDIDSQLGTNWINAHRPSGYRKGVIESFPVISSSAASNTVKVLYTRKPAQTGDASVLQLYTVLVLGISFAAVVCFGKGKRKDRM